MQRLGWLATRTLLLLCLFGQLVSLQLAHAAPCGPRFNFYPPGAEDRNVPSAWGKTAQMAAGNEADDRVFTVVLTAAHNLPHTDAASLPVLQVVPSHPLLELGTAGVSQRCMGFAGALDDAEEEEEAAAAFAAADAADAAAEPQDSSEETEEETEEEAKEETEEETPSPSPAAPAAAEQPAPAGLLQMPDNARHLLQVPGNSSKTSSAAGDGSDASSSSMHWHSWGSDAAEQQYLAATGQQLQQQRQQQHQQQQQQQQAGSLQQRRLLQDRVVTAPAAFRVEYEFNDTSMVSLGEFALGVAPPFPSITLTDLQSRDDGYYCLLLRLTILAGTGAVDGIAVPLTDLVNTTHVCFYKLDGQPSAKVDFQSCSETFNVIVTEVSPPPVSLFPGSSRHLFLPVLHFTSDLNRTKSGAWPPNDVVTKMEHWLVMDTPRKAGKPYIWTPEERLAEGWWNIKLEAGLATPYPTLMPLAAPGTSTLEYSDEKAPEIIKDRSKFFANHQYPNGTVLGVQYKPTQFRFMEGPEGDLFPVNAEISFNWDFEGFGHMYCYIDGKPFENYGEHTCAPPLTMNVPDKKNHTLTIVMLDACGTANMTVKAAYGTWGYSLLQVPDLGLGFESGEGELSGPGGASSGAGPVYDIAASNTSAAALRSQRKAVAAGAAAAAPGRWQWLGPALALVLGQALLPRMAGL